MAITECPRKVVTADICELLDYVALAQKGLLPLAGGLLDQTQWFVQAVQYVWAEQRVAKAGLGG